MPFLKYTSATRGVIWIELGGKPTALGRSADCTLQLDDESASRRHCEIRYEKGRWFAVDLGSKNGTWVNGVTPKAGEPLKDGDLITMSNSSVKYCENKT